jgi:hypothetical protein
MFIWQMQQIFCFHLNLGLTTLTLSACLLQAVISQIGIVVEECIIIGNASIATPLAISHNIFRSTIY